MDTVSVYLICVPKHCCGFITKMLMNAMKTCHIFSTVVLMFYLCTNTEISCFLCMYLNTVYYMDIARTNQELESEKKSSLKYMYASVDKMHICWDIDPKYVNRKHHGTQLFLCRYLCTKLAEMSSVCVCICAFSCLCLCVKLCVDGACFVCCNRWFAFITSDILRLTAFSVTMETGN